MLSITRTKAGYVTVPQLIGSRYVHQVAICLFVAFAPAVAATVRPIGTSAARDIRALAAAGLLTVFVLNLGQIEPQRHFFEAWAANDKSKVRQTVAIVTGGCVGGVPDFGARPARDVDPSPLTVGLIRDLLARGALSPEFGNPADTTGAGERLS